MPAAARALLLVLLPRACLGFGDDVLLLQQPPESRSLDADREPQSFAHGFGASATSAEPELALAPQPAAVVAQQEALVARIGKPGGRWAKHNKTAHKVDAAPATSDGKPEQEDADGKPKQELGSLVAGLPPAASDGPEQKDADGKPKQEPGSLTVGLPGNKTAMALGSDLAPTTVVGQGQCQDSTGLFLTPYDEIPGLSSAQCVTRCVDDATCKGGDFLEAVSPTRLLSLCRKFSVIATKSNTIADMTCFQKTPQPSPTGQPGTATGDPHLTTMRGKKFDVKRPGNHTLLVVPHGASEDDANLYVWADVTPLDKVACKNLEQLYITQLTLTGSWLKSIGSLRLSTGTRDFNTPATWGLSIGGSGNLSLQEFTSRLPPAMAYVNVTHPAGPHPNPSKHVDTMLLELNLGRSNVTVGWAHTGVPKSNWLWFNIGDLGLGKLGGLLGDDDYMWVTVKPVECQEP